VAANPLWAVALGSATLPVSGNLANLNNFIHAAQYTTLAGQLGDRLSIAIASTCRTPDDAAHLERTLRAFVSLAGMRGGAPGDIRIERRDREIRVALSADAALFQRLVKP
jgi:hypothetical protein